MSADLTPLEASLKERAITYGKASNAPNPFVVLLDEVRRTAGHVEWLGYRVGQLADNEVLIRDVKFELIENPLIRLYRAERSHLLKACAEAIRGGVAEAVVRSIETEGAMIARALSMALDELGLSDDLRLRASGALERALRYVDQAGPAGYSDAGVVQSDFVERMSLIDTTASDEEIEEQEDEVTIQASERYHAGLAAHCQPTLDNDEPCQPAKRVAMPAPGQAVMQTTMQP